MTNTITISRAAAALAAAAGLAAATRVLPRDAPPVTRLPPGTADIPPTWPVTYAANQSAYLYYCSWTRPFDPAPVANWSIASLDWSNQKWGPEGWATSKPMDCEERLYADATNFVARSSQPRTARGMVYRNTCKALPWFKTVRDKLADPAYAAWFLRYGPTPPINGTSYYSPSCDANYDPPLCSPFYHDSAASPDFARMPRCQIDGDCSVQVPGFPFGDGNCSAPACDVGAVPVGEYVFDPRAWNVSVNGQTLGQWWLEDYLFGALGAGDTNITGFYFDDSWSDNGCSELDSHQVADLGMSADELQQARAAYESNFAQVYAELVKRGAYTEQQFTRAGPPGSTDSCTRSLRQLCPAPPPALLVDMDDSRPELSMALYLLARGPYGFFGHTWAGGCQNEDGGMPPEVPNPKWFPELFDADYGVPVGLCAETAPQVFTRAWTKAVVTVDCTDSAHGFAPNITLLGAGGGGEGRANLPHARADPPGTLVFMNMTEK